MPTPIITPFTGMVLGTEENMNELDLYRNSLEEAAATHSQDVMQMQTCFMLW